MSSNSYLIETGDYIPYFYLECGNKVLDIQAKASQFNLLVFLQSDIDRDEIFNNLDCECEYYTYFICNRDLEIDREQFFFDTNLFSLFAEPNSEKYHLFLCDRNLKVIKQVKGNNYPALLTKLPSKDSFKNIDVKPPILIIPNVISPSLARELIDYLEENSDKLHRDNHKNKSRNHLHPDKDLITALDIKLTKSLLPEISKVLYSDITHRETYKITSYDSNYSGRFYRHRDTIDPYLHRRYALSLLLNDDYKGGGLIFPEYSDKIVTAPEHSAIIFPGSLYHEVKPIKEGKRYALISFFFTEAEARLKSYSDRYKFTITRNLKGVKTKQITPQAIDKITTLPQAFIKNNWSIITKPISFSTNLAKMSFNNESDDSLTQKEAKDTVETENALPKNLEEKNKIDTETIPVIEISDPPTASDYLALAEQALAQSLLDKTEQYLDIFDGTVKENSNPENADLLLTQREEIANKLQRDREQKETFLVLIAGDSLSLPRPWYLKKFDPELNPFLSTNYFDTYPQLLEDYLAEHLQYKKIRVNNSLAQRGFNITSLTARLPDIFAYYDPDLIIIQVGVVDCWLRGENLDRQDVPLPQYQKELTRIFNYRKKACPNKPLIIMGLCPTDPKLYKRNTGMNRIIEEYNNTIQELILKETGVYYFDTSALIDVKNPYKLIHKDGIHFSTNGHQLIAKALNKTILKVCEFSNYTHC